MRGEGPGARRIRRAKVASQARDTWAFSRARRVSRGQIDGMSLETLKD